MSAKITATREVRQLLVKLDYEFQRYHVQVGALAGQDKTLSEHAISNIALDHRYTKETIIGIAWQINRASRGESNSPEGVLRHLTWQPK